MIDDTTHSAASGSEPTSGEAHVHLLLPDGENRRLLEEWLGQRYTVTTGTTAASLDRAFDLCLITQATFARYTQELLQRKNRAAPTFLPYLMLLDEHSAATVEPRVWEHVDELVTTPIEKRELQGRLSGLLARRDLSKRLAERGDRIRRILEAIPDPLLIIDEEGTVLGANESLETDTDLRTEAIVGSTLEELESLPAETTTVLRDLSTAIHDSVTEADREIGADNQTASGDQITRTDTTVTFRQADGTIGHAEVGVAPLSNPDGEDQQTLFVFRDVTAQIARERELERQRDRLEDFADMLAHEVRNPLNISQGFLDQISPTDEREAAAMDRVVAANKRMEQMITELLAHTRDDLSSDVQSVDLEDVARSAWKQTPTEQLCLQIDVDGRDIDADPKSLQTVFENLFRNAMEHAEGGTTVRVGAVEGGGFYVEDDGDGIPPEARDHVLDRGYTTNSAGTGLGLALVRRVAQAHDWSIRVTDSEDGGARFGFVVSSAE